MVDAKVSDSHAVVKQVAEDGTEVFLGFGRNEDQQITRRSNQPQVRSPTPFELAGKKVKQFWAVDAATVFEFTDGTKEVFGKANGLEEFLSDGCLLKSSHLNASIILRY